MESEARAFHTVEYTLLRQELSNNAQSAQEALIYSIVANAAIVAWVSLNIEQSKSLGNVLSVAAWLPVLITLSAWFINIIRRRQVWRIATYCSVLEKALGSTDYGWESFYSKHRNVGVLGRIHSRRIHDFLFVLQMALGIYFLLFIYFGIGKTNTA